MRLSLKLHPDFQSAAVGSIEVEVAHAEMLTLRYVVTGQIAQILFPAKGEPRRANELWKHTCFEAFLRATASEAYLEFNFSPSTQWAAYRFTGYRRDMQIAADIASPRIETTASADRYELRASVLVPKVGTCRLGISAIIEEVGGGKSYWALAHPPGRPDFHHDDSFAYDLR